ncbi:hypothetical protein BGW80DRAFT_506940 [Lactifluus volemus]|nr:hypothetical protein BGW80DRAFT_506940 [Lactifluus volemus]
MPCLHRVSASGRFATHPLALLNLTRQRYETPSRTSRGDGSTDLFTVTSDLVAVMKTDLGDRIHGSSSLSNDSTDVRDKVQPLIQNLVRTKSLRESKLEERCA